MPGALPAVSPPHPLHPSSPSSTFGSTSLHERPRESVDVRILRETQAAQEPVARRVTHAGRLERSSRRGCWTADEAEVVTGALSGARPERLPGRDGWGR